MTTMKQEKTVKNTFRGVAIFYFLIAFEFFYMASPFAVYFYSIYKPTLNFFNQYPPLAWLISFFMPHAVVETSSFIINMHNTVGAILAVLGFLGFCFGACQIYYNKLTKKGAVTGGIYNFIRHPQYAFFIICSFGLLILWPRYIVLIMFTTMIFIYYFLAKIEEKECEAKFGQAYIDYKNKTSMFLPFRIAFSEKLPSLPKSKLGKFITVIGIYILTLAIAIGIAKGINTLSLNSLYAIYTKDSANIAVCKIESNKLEEILNIALSNREVKDKIGKVEIGKNAKFLNYILPSEWYAAEIPMNGIKRGSGHSAPTNYDRNLYKIIFTKAEMRSKSSITEKNIITNVIRREPIVEVWVDIAKHKVLKVEEIPEKIMYQNIPVAVY